MGAKAFPKLFLEIVYNFPVRLFTIMMGVIMLVGCCAILKYM